MDSKKLKKRKKLASKPKRMSFFEELNRPVTYILDDVKETIVTENTYKVCHKLLCYYSMLYAFRVAIVITPENGHICK